MGVSKLIRARRAVSPILKVESGRPITDAEAMDAFRLLCRTEGIIPAIESAHAVAGALKLGVELGPGSVIVVNLSGRGDKDVETAAKWFGLLDGADS